MADVENHPDDQQQREGRAASLEAILSSDARLKVIVAGPGTGKTFTFKTLLAQLAGQGLAMTFLNSLVRELSASLSSLAEVYSFHGFAHRLLRQLDGTGVSRGLTYYPTLIGLFIEDIRIVRGEILDAMSLGALFRNLAEHDPMLVQALASGEYYDSASYDDGVYRVLRAMEADASRIPVYDQVVVDEYQDFCPMDVAFIAALARRNPTLIVGDDDQALYAFRDASPQAIRDLATEGVYQRFELPYCSRCTAVVVAATHRVVAQARTHGLLQERIDKRYECYLPEKRAESEQYPTIIHARCSTQTSKAPYMARYIEQAILGIPDEEISESHDGGYPTVLVIGPKQFLGQIESYLGKLFRNVSKPTSESPQLDALDAYRLLVSNPESNLGWRILAQLFQPSGWETAVRNGLEAGSPLRELLALRFVEEQLHIVEVVALALEGVELTPAEQRVLAEALGVVEAELENRIRPVDVEAEEVDPLEPWIMLTSLMGSKGLQAGHVFVVGVADGHFPRHNNQVTNEEVCQLLVALTRTRKSCTLVSTGRLGAEVLGASVFVRWLRPFLSEVSVDRHYFSS